MPRPSAHYRLHTVVCFLLLAVIMLLPAQGMSQPALSQNEKATIQFFESVRHSPPMMRAFLGAMPKGADLHTHLSGAVYAEDYLQWAMEDGRCIDTATFTILSPDAPSNKSTAQDPCPQGSVPAERLFHDNTLYTDAVNALSTRDMHYVSRMWGHEQFFNSFAKFNAGKLGRGADMLASVIRRAAGQNILHLEVMDSIYPATLKNIATSVGWSGNAEETLAALRQAGLFESIEHSVAARRALLDEARFLLQAGLEEEPGAAAGASAPLPDVSVRFIQQIHRNSSPEQVFAQLAYSFELVRHDPNVVAFNLVAPEDYPTALRDYSLHMRMIGALHALPEYTGTSIALHAGELAMGLVPPRDLRFHIREAVETGHARRIGHGVSVMHEDNAFGLLRTMRERRVAVEICLSSNDQILGVRGADHPFPVYRKYGVPMVLNTDDEGVARIDLTNEYLRAATTYALGYQDMKALSRNSLEYSFLSGASLWSDPAAFIMGGDCKDSPMGHETALCARLLEASDKARMQWQLEKAFVDFERDVAESMSRQ